MKIYRDVNFNGILEPNTGGLIISTGTFLQPDPNGTNTKTLDLAIKPQTISPTSQTYFVTYDIATGATSNNTEGLTISNPGYFAGSLSPAGVDSMAPLNFPTTSRKVTISPLLVSVRGNSIVPGSVLQGSSQVPLLAVTVTPSINQVIIATVTISQLGTITTSTGTPPNVVGDGDITKLYVYQDTNFNGILDAGDPLVGSLTWGTTGQFAGGLATIPLSVPVTFNTSGGTLLIAGDIGTTDGAGASTQGHTVGVSLAGATALGLSPETALQDPGNVYPVQSGITTIYNFQTVQISSISMRPDITYDDKSALKGLFMPNAWVSQQAQLSAYWLTTPPAPLPSNVSVTYQAGVSVSTNTAVAPSLTGWLPVSAPPVTLNGLGLQDKQTYYFFVRTITTINGITLPPSPAAIGTAHVDVTKPAAPDQFLNLPKSAPSGVVTLQWDPVSAVGPSGLFAYKIRQFKGTSPVPTEIIMTSTPTFTFGANSSPAGANSAGAPRIADGNDRAGQRQLAAVFP